MNIIVATSRGRGLQDLAKRREDTVLSVHPGASLRKLEREALRLLKHVPSSSDTHLYFVAGLPDVTHRHQFCFQLRGRRRKYEEVIMPTYPIDKITDDITPLFKSTAEKIKNANATPIFSTICPMSLDTWNHRRLSQHRTSHLSSFPYYPLMQEKHESVILKINQEIHLLNKSYNMHTPRLAKSVMYHRKGQLRCRYGRLVDGVHPNHNLQLEWVDTLDRVLDLNRSSPNQLPPPEPVKSQPDDEEYDSDSSTKRSWLYWWRWLCVSGWTVLTSHFRFS